MYVGYGVCMYVLCFLYHVWHVYMYVTCVDALGLSEFKNNEAEMTSRESVVSATAVLLTNDQHSKESANQVRDSLNLVRDSLNQVRDSVNQVKDSVHPIKDPPNQGSDSSVVTDTKSREVTIRFRWYVTLPTTASQILFNCPFSVVCSPENLQLTYITYGSTYS